MTLRRIALEAFEARTGQLCSEVTVIRIYQLDALISLAEQAKRGEWFSLVRRDYKRAAVYARSARFAIDRMVNL